MQCHARSIQREGNGNLVISKSSGHDEVRLPRPPPEVLLHRHIEFHVDQAIHYSKRRVLRHAPIGRDPSEKLTARAGKEGPEVKFMFPVRRAV